MNILCTITNDILHIAEILIICKCYLHLQENVLDKYRYIKIFSITVATSVIIYLIENSTIILIIYLFCVETIILICYSGIKRKLLVCGIATSVVVEIIYLMSMSIIDTIFRVSDNNNELLQGILSSILSLIIIYVVSLLLKRISKNGVKNISTNYMIVFTVILLADFFMLMMMLVVTLDEVSYRNKILYIVVYVSVAAGIFIQLTAVILLLVSRNEHKEKEQIIKEYLEEQVKYYEYLENKEKETKKFRHDIRSHLYFLNKLKNEGNSQKFDEYLQEIIDKVDDLGNNINVGNDIVNAVINKAYTEADERNIKLKVSGHFPARCNTSTYNLCTIFYNLLNNAIEAADKTEKREVWVICRYTDKEIIVEIGNYFYSKERLDKNKLHTTKSEKDYHGWGMKNVQDSVRDSEGLMDIEIKEDKFIVSLTLNNHL